MLAGDLFARPGLDRRGGSGDVRSVRRAFARRCRWVAGVAGNHDLFFEEPNVGEFEQFCEEPGVNFLDGRVVELDGLRIGGVSGIIGTRGRLFRREEEAYTDVLLEVLSNRPEVVILHDGPDVPHLGLRGSSIIRETLSLDSQVPVIRGHARWKTPLAELDSGMQILNVDSIAVVLVEASQEG